MLRGNISRPQTGRRLRLLRVVPHRQVRPRQPGPPQVKKGHRSRRRLTGSSPRLRLHQSSPERRLLAPRSPRLRPRRQPRPLRGALVHAPNTQLEPLPPAPLPDERPVSKSAASRSTRRPTRQTRPRRHPPDPDHAPGRRRRLRQRRHHRRLYSHVAHGRQEASFLDSLFFFFFFVFLVWCVSLPLVVVVSFDDVCTHDAFSCSTFSSRRLVFLVGFFVLRPVVLRPSLSSYERAPPACRSLPSGTFLSDELPRLLSVLCE
mmetsp:Transcript_22733/g.69883  ORF Transcript_22733/g.69883 Transcript_22733/m.69883 type:complete len:261 (-) Transcript_22733:98-880(-)